MPASNEPLIVGIKGSFDNQNLLFVPNLPNFKIVENLDDPLVKSADGYMQTNIYKDHLIEYKDQYDFIKESGKPFLVYESPVFRRGTTSLQDKNPLYMQRVGWNHFMRQGIFCNENSPPDRFNQIQKDQNIEIKPWRAKGDYILFILQKPNDSSLEQVHKVWGNNYWNYVVDCLKHIRKHTDMPIVLRGHPKARTTSNTLIESACLGIPTFALDDTAMSWPVCQPNLSYLENPKLDIPREQWLYDLAWTQYYFNEHKSGFAWNRLKPYYFS